MNRLVIVKAHSSMDNVRQETKVYSSENLVVLLITYLRSGASLIDACNLVRGWKSSQMIVDFSTISSLVHRCVHGEESQKEQLIKQLAAVCILSQKAGCSAAKCLEILHEDMRRHERTEQKRQDATAIARLTIRVLLGLPIITTVLSELTGAHAITFLFSTPLGLICFLCAAVCYATGMVWSNRLIRQFHKTARHLSIASGL